MSELTLTKSGFKRRRWNDELRGIHDFKKQEDGSVIVLHEDTKEEVARYASEDEAREAYWEDVPDDRSWIPALRDSVKLEEGVTVEDLIAAIKEHDELEATALNLNENWEQFALGVIDGPVEVCVNFFIGEELTVTPGTVQDSDKKGEPRILTEADKMHFIGAIGPEYEGTYHMSLFEIMEALFVDGRPGPVHFTCENGVVTLRNDKGESVDDPLERLLSYVEVHDEITLNQFFQWVDQHELLTTFIGAYSWCRQIKAFHTEANLPLEAADSDDKNELYRSEVVRHVEVNQYRRADEPHINDWVDFVCWGEMDEESKKWYQPKYAVRYDTLKSQKNTRVFREDDGATSKEEARRLFEEFCERVGIEGATITSIDFEEGSDCPNEQRYGVGFSPAYHYSHLPFVIVEECAIRKEAMLSRKGRITEPAKELWKGPARLTLLDVLDAIYWEISFYGGPEERDDCKFDMRERVDEIKRSENPDECRTKYFATYKEMFDYEPDADPDGPYDFFAVDHDLDMEPDEE